MSDVYVPQSHLHILETAIQGMLSTIRHKDGLISTNPVGFDWDGEFVRISTLKARVKYANLLADPGLHANPLAGGWTGAPPGSGRPEAEEKAQETRIWR